MSNTAAIASPYVNSLLVKFARFLILYFKKIYKLNLNLKMGDIMDKVGDWLKSFFKEVESSEKADKADLKAIESFQFLIKKEAIIVDQNVIYIYKNIWQYYPGSKIFWRKCACLYLNKNKKDCIKIHIKDMETGKRLDTFDCQVASGDL